jgi:hypothetical protein
MLSWTLGTLMVALFAVLLAVAGVTAGAVVVAKVLIVGFLVAAAATVVVGSAGEEPAPRGSSKPQVSAPCPGSA